MAQNLELAEQRTDVVDHLMGRMLRSEPDKGQATWEMSNRSSLSCRMLWSGRTDHHTESTVLLTQIVSVTVNLEVSSRTDGPTRGKVLAGQKSLAGIGARSIGSSKLSLSNVISRRRSISGVGTTRIFMSGDLISAAGFTCSPELVLGLSAAGRGTLGLRRSRPVGGLKCLYDGNPYSIIPVDQTNSSRRALSFGLLDRRRRFHRDR